MPRTGDRTRKGIFNFKIDYFHKLCNPTLKDDGLEDLVDEPVHPLKNNKVIGMTISFPILTLYLDHEGTLTTINVDYSKTGLIDKAGEETGNVHDNEWYGISTDFKSRITHFNNCVFERPVTIANVKYVSFNNCFFKQGLNIKDSTNAESIAIRECCVEKGIIISESKINRISISDSHIDALFVEECTFERTAMISKVSIGTLMVFNHSNFDGYDTLIEDCEFGNGLIFDNCTSRSRLNINRIRSEQLRFEKCFFRSLNIDDSSVGCGKGPEATCVYMEEDTFTAALSLDNIRCPRLTIVKSNMYGGCYVTRHDDRSSLVIPGLAEGESLVQSIYISKDRMGNEFQIGNIYNQLKIEETEFNCKIRLNCVYTQLLSKGLITRLNPESRMVETKPKVLFDISNAMKLHNQPYASEYFFIAYKAARHAKATTRGEKAKYTTHDLLSKFGTSYFRVIAWSIVTVFVFTILYRIFGAADLYTAIYHSGSTFFTIGFSDLEGSNDITKILSVAEGAIGLLLMTYLVIVMTNKKY